MADNNEFQMMDTEATRILYRKVSVLSQDVQENQESVRGIHRRIDWVLYLMIFVLLGCIGVFAKALF